jgi:hypothetical protein
LPELNVTLSTCEERHKGLIGVCKERHKSMDENVECLEIKLKTKVEQREMDELKETVKDKADKDAVKSIRALQIATFLAILGQFLYVIFKR